MALRNKQDTAWHVLSHRQKSKSQLIHGATMVNLIFTKYCALHSIYIRILFSQCNLPSILKGPETHNFPQAVYSMGLRLFPTMPTGNNRFRTFFLLTLKGQLASVKLWVWQKVGWYTNTAAIDENTMTIQSKAHSPPPPFFLGGGGGGLFLCVLITGLNELAGGSVPVRGCFSK